MALFAVVALKGSAEVVDAAVAGQLWNDVYQLESGKWIVNADLTTARQLSEKLGIRETHAHIVFSLRGYSGRAQPDVWEWLKVQAEKVDG